MCKASSVRELAACICKTSSSMRVGLKCSSSPVSMSESSIAGRAGISAGEWMTIVEANEEAGEGEAGIPAREGMTKVEANEEADKAGISAGEGMTKVEANVAGMSTSHKGGRNSAGTSAGDGMTKVEANEAGISMAHKGECNSMSLLATRDTGNEHGLSRTSMMVEWESFRFHTELEAMSETDI